MVDKVKSSWMYHPLDGQELLKWVFADAWQKLQADGQFGSNLAYHNPKYVMKLEVMAYDASAKGATNGAMVESAGQMETTPEPQDKGKHKRFSLSVDSEPMKEPDRARELLDEGRYKTVSKDGVLVDEKVKK